MESHVGNNLTFCQTSRDQIVAYLAENSDCLVAVADGCHAVVPLTSWMGETSGTPPLREIP